MVSDEHLVTVLTTNIVDYVALCERLTGLNTMGFLNEEYYEIVHGEILARGGRLGPVYGDRQTAWWPHDVSPKGSLSACDAARRIVSRIAVRRADLPPGRRFDIIVAIATGEAVPLNGILVGRPVNDCARILQLAKGLHRPVLVDETTYFWTDKGTRDGMRRAATPADGPPLYDLPAG